MKVLKRVDNNLEKVILAILLTAICCVTMLQVIMRFVVRHALPWPEEVTRYCLVLLCFFSVPYCIRFKLNLRIDMFTRMFNKTVMSVINLVIYLIMIFCLGYFTLAGCTVCRDAYRIQSMASSIPVPLYVIYGACVAALVIGLFRIIEMILLEIISFSGKGGS